MVFELYDTYGFPYDLTELIAKEDNLKIDKKSFDSFLEQQRDRSRKSSNVSSEDWKIVNDNFESNFKGYDELNLKSKIIKYRQANLDNKKKYHVVFSATPSKPR